MGLNSCDCSEKKREDLPFTVAFAVDEKRKAEIGSKHVTSIDRLLLMLWTNSLGPPISFASS